ncbi:MAG TPA: diaminopimelate decarboxylase [Frankiaceae bacterium]|nr:diaminopimelate decarboxylase [Frankiaceae bacterium]
MLDPALWPSTATVTDGVLSVGGVAVTDLAAGYGTPLYVLDEADVRERCRAWREAFADADVYYAGKAFLCSAMVRIVAEEGLGLDVCTGGELAVALRGGMPGERIGFHGNNKSVAELRAAVAAGVGRIVVDSFEEIDRVASIAAEAGVRQRVMVRATVGVEAHTHEFIATAHEDQKFGFSLASGAAAHAVGRVLDAPALELVGVHSHIGSQIFDAAGFEVAAHRVVSLLVRVRDEHGVELPELNLGGGLGIAYVPGDDPIGPKALAQQLRDIVENECAHAGLRVPRLAVEPGRHIAGPPAITVYEVGTVKDVDRLRTYVSVDGGMSDNIRTALYEAEYTCRIASRESAAPEVAARVVGKHCETGDVVVRDARLPEDVRPGDLLAVAATGAYCRSMASNYNHVPRPPVVAVRDGRSRVIVRRETEDDLLALDVVDA